MLIQLKSSKKVKTFMIWSILNVQHVIDYQDLNYHDHHITGIDKKLQSSNAENSLLWIHPCNTVIFIIRKSIIRMLFLDLVFPIIEGLYSVYAMPWDLYRVGGKESLVLCVYIFPDLIKCLNFFGGWFDFFGWIT